MDVALVDNIKKDESIFKVLRSRSSNIICFYGVPGSGKTIAMSYFGLYFYLRGRDVLSNYHLVYPHKMIENLDDLDNSANCVGLFDDFEFIGSSKFLKSSEKKDLLQISLMFSKRGISPVMYSVKRPMECDKTLRSLTDYFVHCSLELKYIPHDEEEFDYLSKYLDAHRIRLDVYNANDLSVVERVVYIDDLDVYSCLYDTREEVSKLV